MSFSEAEKAAALWSKLHSSKFNRNDSRYYSPERSYNNRRELDRKYNGNRDRTGYSRDVDKGRRSPRKSERYDDKPLDVGRDPSIRGRTRSRSRSPLVDRSRRSTGYRSRSRSPPSSGKWSHDKFSDVSNSESARNLPPDYRPPSPTWVSKAGGVAVMRKKVGSSY